MIIANLRVSEFVTSYFVQPSISEGPAFRVEVSPEKAIAPGEPGDSVFLSNGYDAVRLRRMRDEAESVRLVTRDEVEALLVEDKAPPMDESAKSAHPPGTWFPAPVEHAQPSELPIDFSEIRSWIPDETGGSSGRKLHDQWTELHEAAWRGDKVKVDLLLRTRPDLLEAKDQAGRTPLKIANDRARDYHGKGRWKEAARYAEIVSMIMNVPVPEPSVQSKIHIVEPEKIFGYRPTIVSPAPPAAKADRPTQAQLDQKFLAALQKGDYDGIVQSLNEGANHRVRYNDCIPAYWAKQQAVQIAALETPPPAEEGCGRFADCASLLFIADYVAEHLIDQNESRIARIGAIAEVVFHSVGKGTLLSSRSPYDAIKTHLSPLVRDNLGLKP